MSCWMEKIQANFFFLQSKQKLGPKKCPSVTHLLSVRHADHLSFFASYRANVLTKYFETVHIYSWQSYSMILMSKLLIARLTSIE